MVLLRTYLHEELKNTIKMFSNGQKRDKREIEGKNDRNFFLAWASVFFWQNVLDMGLSFLWRF